MTTASQKKKSLLASARDLACRHSISIFTVMAFAAIVSAATLFHSPPGHAQTEQDDRDHSRIEEGFDIAPVPLDLEGKNRALVGLGSYLVNAVAVCNDCHSAGPQTQFAPGGNPFFGQPTKINPATYLGERQRRFDEHRAWMMRSYSLTFAAATVRLSAFPLLVFTRDPVVAITGAFWTWILNLVVAEWFIRRRSPLGAPNRLTQTAL